MISEPLQPLAVDITTLRTLEKNPRRGEVKAIMRSLERFGQRKPIVALPNGTVIAGNHTLMAARELGWDEIAVMVTDDDPQTAKGFALADNRTGDLGTYDEEILAELLVEVSDDPELLLATGYTAEDVDALVHITTPPSLDDLIDDIGSPTDDDALERVVLKVSSELADALRSEIARIGSHEQAVSLWLNL
jgi:ParB-like chromosome segregation protein Spo0J